MPNAPTPNLGLAVPTVGGDVGAWGGELNGNLSLIDSLLGAVKVVVANSSQTIVLGQPFTFIEATAGAAGIALTLSVPAPVIGWVVIVKMMDTGIGGVTLAGLSGNIEGAPNYQLVNQNQVGAFIWDGVNWWLIFGD